MSSLVLSYSECCGILKRFSVERNRLEELVAQDEMLQEYDIVRLSEKSGELIIALTNKNKYNGVRPSFELTLEIGQVPNTENHFFIINETSAHGVTLFEVLSFVEILANYEIGLKQSNSFFSISRG